MLHIYKRNDGQYGVVNLAKNRQVTAPNEGFTRKENAFGNILAQWKSFSFSGYVRVQDDTTNPKPTIWLLYTSGKKVKCSGCWPERRYTPKKKKKK